MRDHSQALDERGLSNGKPDRGQIRQLPLNVPDLPEEPLKNQVEGSLEAHSIDFEEHPGHRFIIAFYRTSPLQVSKPVLLLRFCRSVRFSPRPTSSFAGTP
mgnify:FL=1